MNTKTEIELTYKQWEEEGIKRYGEDKTQWKFKCPSCGYVAKVQDWLVHEHGEKQAGFSCIGRLQGTDQHIFTEDGGPCNYAGGGLFRLNPIKVTLDGEDHLFFDFADDSLCEKGE